MAPLNELLDLRPKTCGEILERPIVFHRPQAAGLTQETKAFRIRMAEALGTKRRGEVVKRVKMVKWFKCGFLVEF